jgi:dihydrolipoamide dehydrogenase
LKIIIIGGGPGGNEAARKAAAEGHETIVIEKDRFGGTCTNCGCVPTKFLLSAVEQEISRSGREIDQEGWIKIQKRKEALTKGLSKKIEEDIIAAGVTVVKGRAELIGPREVVVQEGNGSHRYQGDALILATGSSILRVPALRMDGKRVLTSDQALRLTEIPSSLIVIGSGPVGTEFAFLFNRLGTRVTLVDALPQLMPTEDEDVAAVIQKDLQRRGMGIRTGTRVMDIENHGPGVKVRLEDGSLLEAELAMVAVGRKINTDNLGLGEADIALNENGGVKVDEHLETSARGVFAVGDVTGSWLLAHVAATQGVLAVKNIPEKTRPMDYRAIPYAVFIQPELATVGMNENKAREQGVDYLQGKAMWTRNIKARIEKEQQGFIKILADRRTGRLIGGTIVGTRAADMIHTLAMAINCGVKAKDFARGVFIHPTLSESFHNAAEDLS